MNPSAAPPELLLASTSPYRQALLAKLGIPFRSTAPLIDEESFKHSATSPRALAETLAQAKAQSLALAAPDAIIIAGDQVLALSDQFLGKPGNLPRARDQLFALSGQRHELITALAVLAQGRLITHTDVTTLWMRALSSKEIDRYLDADQPLDCAGSYKIEERGIALFERIESADHTSIMGMPLIALTSILRDLGLAIP